MYARGLVYVLYECLLVGYDVNIYIIKCLVLCSTIVHGLVTWLILPVVIRLSQRLSHACLSINNYTVKLRMAHYISYSLFDSILLLG